MHAKIIDGLFLSVIEHYSVLANQILKLYSCDASDRKGRA